MPAREPTNKTETRDIDAFPRTSISSGKRATVLRRTLLAMVGFTSQIRARSGVITSAKPKPVTDMHAAARKAMPIAAASVSADNR